MISLVAMATHASVVAENLDQDTRKTLVDNALPIAGLFVVVLGVALFFLWKSMNKQIKRIDPGLPEGRDDREQARDRALTDEAVKRGENPDDAVAG